MTLASSTSPDRIGDYVLPGGWQVATIGELFELQQGKALSAAARTAEERYPFLRTSNVLWGRVDLSSVDRMGMSETERSRLRLRDRDLLVCEGGEIGRAAVWHGEVDECYFQNHIHRLRARDECVLPEFYCFWLQVAFTRLGIYEGAGTKTTIANLSGGRLSALKVPQPPLDDQARIVRILAAINNSVDKGSISLSARQVTRNALATRLLGSPETNSEPYLFSDVVDVVSGQVDPRTEPFLSLPHIAPDNIESGTGRLLPVKTAGELGLISGKYQFQPGDIIYSKIRPYLNKATVAPFRGTCSADMYVLRADETRLLQEFLFYLLLDDDFLQQAVSHQGRTGIPKINREQMNSISLRVPSLEFQSQIVRMLKVADRFVESERALIACSQSLFDAAIGPLMSGGSR